MGVLVTYSGTLTIEPPISIKEAKVINAFDRDTVGGPGDSCDFKVNDDGDLEHDGSEKDSSGVEWLKFISLHLLAQGHMLNGTFEVSFDEYGETEDYIVEDGVVYVQKYDKIKADRTPA